jgi:hypothetical protein
VQSVAVTSGDGGGQGRYTRPDHVDRELIPALEGFHRALSRRWQKLVAQAITDNRWDFPQAIRREVRQSEGSYPNPAPGFWNFSTEEARQHILTNNCSTLRQVLHQEYDPESLVSCEGAAFVNSDVTGYDSWVAPEDRFPDGPPYIDCGVKSILRQVVDWAWAERNAVFERLPLFDGLDLDLISQAHHDLIELGVALGLAAGAGSEAGLLAPYTTVEPEDRRIPQLVDGVRFEDTPGAGRKGLWADWTGLQADAAGSGFFASVAPTLRHQAGIAGSLANLYAYRAAIIEKGRNDGLYYVEWATESLDETKTEATSYTSGWKAMQGLGMGTVLAVGWHPVGAAVGSTVDLAGFLGELFFPEGPTREEPLNDMVEVVETLHNKISGLTHGELYTLEGDYYTTVNRLHSLIFNTHNYNLELYDFGENDPEGRNRDPDNSGFGAEIESILGIADFCYELGERYGELLPILARTLEAGQHLAGEDSSPTRADTRLLELRDLLESFLKTTCGRYLVAGEQTRDAAKVYVDQDDTQRQAFLDFEREWGGGYDVDFNPAEYARETERHGRAGERDPDADYEVEGDG